MSLIKNLERVIFSDMTSLIWMLGWIAVVLSAGFFFGQTSNDNYNLLNSTLGKELWGFLFLFYGVTLLWDCMKKINDSILILTYIAGIWFWSYLFFSFTIFDKSPTASTEWMLGLPIVAQVWIFFNHLYNKRVQKIDNEIITIVMKVLDDVHLLSNELRVINKENEFLKTEFDRLSGEVRRIQNQYKQPIPRRMKWQ